jgi:hypothetical protein
MVAHRETSHYHVFKRRIAELGYSWTETPDPDFEDRLQVSGSALPDVEKIRWGKAKQAQRRGPTIRDRRADDVSVVGGNKEYAEGGIRTHLSAEWQ